MSKFAILKMERAGSGEPEGEITVNVDHVAAIESAGWSGGQHTTITLCTGRTLNIVGDHKAIRRALAIQSITAAARPVSLFEQIFGR